MSKTNIDPYAQLKESFKRQMDDGIDASLEGRHNLAGPNMRWLMRKRANNKQAALMLAVTNAVKREKVAKETSPSPVFLLAMTKKAAEWKGMDKEAQNPWYQPIQGFMDQYINPYAGQAYGALYGGPQGGAMGGMPGSPWMYGTGAGAGLGYMLGDQMGSGWGGALMGGGLGYLLNNWAQKQYQNQQAQGAGAGAMAGGGQAAPGGQVAGQVPQGNDVFNQFDQSLLAPGTVGGQTPAPQIAQPTTGQDQQQSAVAKPPTSKVTFEGPAADNMQPTR